MPLPSAAELVTLDPATVARFAGDVAGVLGQPLAPQDSLALAVSGGPDSMAMLVLAAAAFPGRVLAATVDHRLRAEAADEARMVARWCADARIPHAILAPDVPPSGASLQAQARQVRYDLLGTWAAGEQAAALLTAHHADDQAETFLMRAVRGSGPSGLAGIRARWTWTSDRWGSGIGDVAVARPLLGWRRRDLRALALTADLPFVDDPANADPRHDRTSVRAILAATPALDVSGLARAAAYCAEADASLGELHDWLWRTRTYPAAAGELRLDVTDLPRELRRRLVRTAVTQLRSGAALEGLWSEAANVERLLDALNAGQAATRAGVHAAAAGAVWTFRAAPPRRSP